MSQAYFTILTNFGAARLAEATATEIPLKLTYLAVGDGNGNVPLPTQTQLINEVRRSTINTVYTDKQNENYIIVEQVIPPEEGGFYIRELGVFDDKGNLIAVGNCPPSYKPKLSEGSGRTLVINMVIMVDNTGTVELKIDPSTVLATRKYVDDLISSKMTEHEKSTNHPYATTTQEGLVKLSSSVTSESEQTAATSKAVKTAYDFAAEKLSASGGTIIGDLNVTGKLQQAGSDVVTTDSIAKYTSYSVPDYSNPTSINKAAGTTFEAPKDGIIHVKYIVQANTENGLLRIGSFDVFSVSKSNAYTGIGSTTVIPIGRGDILTVVSSSLTALELKFLPFK